MMAMMCLDADVVAVVVAVVAADVAWKGTRWRQSWDRASCCCYHQRRCCCLPPFVAASCLALPVCVSKLPWKGLVGLIRFDVMGWHELLSCCLGVAY